MQKLVELYTEYAQTQSDILDLLRARIFQFVVWVLFSISVLVALFFWLVPSKNPEVLNLVYLINGTLIILYLAALFAIRFTDSTYVAGHFITAWTSIIICGLISITAGPMLSDVTPLIILPIGMAFILLGVQGAASWGIICVVTFVVLSVLSINGVEFPHLLRLGNKLRNQTVMWGVCFFFLVTILMAYEWAIQELINERGGNYSLLHRQFTEAERSSNIVKPNMLETFIHGAIQRNENFHDKVMVLVIELIADNESPETILQHVAQQLHDTVRKIDTVVRISETEICIIFENLHSQEGAEHIHTFLEKNLSLTQDSSLKIRSLVYPDQAKNLDAVFQLLWHKRG